jgi:hypothetical protein
MTEKQFNKTLGLFPVGKPLHKYFTMDISDGVKYATINTGCFWFLDIIMTYQSEKCMESQPFQVWELKRKEPCVLIVTVLNINKMILTQFDIEAPYPYNYLAFYCINNYNVFLPNEFSIG